MQRGMAVTIKRITDKEKVEKILKAIKDNEGYCPCSIVKTKETKCMCKDFLDRQEDGYCHCGLYYKTMD